MAYEFQHRETGTVFQGRSLEIVVDDEKDIGEVYLDGDLIYQATDVFTEDQLRREFREDFEVVEALPNEQGDAELETHEPTQQTGTFLELQDEDIVGLQEKLFTKGGEFITDDQREYVGDYHVHPRYGPMIGKYFSGDPLGILKMVDLDTIQELRKAGNGVYEKIDYTVDEIVDPDLGEEIDYGDDIIIDSESDDFY